MASDDDIAAFLPTPPQPAPGPRGIAIDAAMRRFDGREEAPRAPARRASAPSFWATPRRGLAGALVAGLLVAIVGTPVAWRILRDYDGAGDCVTGNAVESGIDPTVRSWYPAISDFVYGIFAVGCNGLCLEPRRGGSQ